MRIVRSPLVFVIAIHLCLAVGGAGCTRAPSTPTPTPTPATATAPHVDNARSGLGADDCVTSPPPVGSAAHAPPPFDGCVAQIDDQRPLPIFDEAATTSARQGTGNMRVCCYSRIGNR